MDCRRKSSQADGRSEDVRSAIKGAAGLDRLQCAALAIVPNSGTTARGSVLRLGTVNNKFLKFCITTSQQGADESRRFLTAWMGLLWAPP